MLTFMVVFSNLSFRINYEAQQIQNRKSTMNKIIDIARSKIGQWRYTNEYPDRLDPETYGGTDCSGFVRWCYLQLGYDIGTWTGDESKAGHEIARGHYPHEIPWEELEPGDLIFMTASYWDNYDFDQYACHVELYCGDGTMIGHPYGYGPQEKYAQSWMQTYGCITWMVRRILGEGDDMTPDEHNLLVEVHNQLTRVDTAGHDNPYGHDFFGRIQMIENAVEKGVASWAYKNENMNGSDDTYQMLTDIRDALRLILRKLDE